MTFERKEKEKEEALKQKIIDEERKRREAIAAREAKKNEPSFGKQMTSILGGLFSDPFQEPPSKAPAKRSTVVGRYPN